MAHCRMLAKQGIITDDEALQILEALAMIMRELDRGEITFYDDYEDIHSLIEKALVEKGFQRIRTLSGGVRKDVDLSAYELQAVS